MTEVDTCYICFEEAEVFCEDCGMPLCPKHALLNEGIQCKQCIENSIFGEGIEEDLF